MINLYILYFFAILAPQILMISSKGSTLDTAYKAVVIVIFLLTYYVFMNHKGSFFVSRSTCVWVILYVTGSVLGSVFSGAEGFGGYYLMGLVAVMHICFLEMPRKVFAGQKQVDRIAAWFLGLMVYACIFNLVTNAGGIVASLRYAGAVNFSSFFDNKNTFGLFLFCGVICACLCMNTLAKKRLPIVALALLFINLIVCASRTALLASACFVLVYFAFANGKNLHALLGTLAVVTILCVFLLQVDAIREFLDLHVFREDRSMVDRNYMAQRALEQMTGIHLLFGYGEDAASHLAKFTGNAYFHNTFIEIFASGGVVKILLYAMVFCKSIKLAFTIFRRYCPKVGAVFIAAWAAYCVYSFGESVVVLNADSQSVALTLILITLPQLYVNAYCAAENGEEASEMR